MKIVLNKAYIRNRMLDLGLSQCDLANRMATRQQNISRMLSDRHEFPPKSKTLERLSIALECHPYELLEVNEYETVG